MVIKLKPGWALDPALPGFRQRGKRMAVSLPEGARLAPALAIDAVPRPTPAEREIARFVHLHWPDAQALQQALALAQSWPCVERASLS